MVDGKHRHNDHPRLIPHILRSGVLRKVPVGQHDALALSGRSGRKHDGRQVLRLRRKACLCRGLGRQLPQMQSTRNQRLIFHGDDMLQLRALLCRHLRNICLCLVKDQCGHIRTVHELAQVFRRKIGIQRYCHAATVHNAVVGCDPGIGGCPYEGDMLPLFP